MNLKKLNEKIDFLLHEEQLNEMSMAWTSRQFNVCAWVENPSGHNNKYFKYYNNNSIKKATKIARISLLAPKYLIHKDTKEIWKLNKRELKILIQLLNSESSRYSGHTNWQDLLITYNMDNFSLQPGETINGFDEKEFPDAFRIDFLMPDYGQLK